MTSQQEGSPPSRSDTPNNANGQQPPDWLTMFNVQHQNMYAMQQQNQQMLQQMMALVSEMQQSSVSRDNKMIVTKTDGTSEDPRKWMKIYELSCDNNKWVTDTQKIVHLKQALEPGSAADRWYSSRIIDQENAPWTNWQASFIQAFSVNRVEAASTALGYAYEDGRLLAYFYEKERLLKLAFGDIPIDAFVTLVMLGLPAYMQDTLLGKDINDKVTLVSEINKLVPLSETMESDDDVFDPHDDEENHEEHEIRTMTSMMLNPPTRS